MTTQFKTTIYQITDPHVPIEKNQVQTNFLTLMDYVQQNPADILVITGDLPGVDGSRQVYEWIKQHLPVNQTTYIIPGNHDDSETLYDVFGKSICVNKDFLFTVALDEIDLIFSNSSSTFFPAEQLAYLQQPSIRKDSVLFTHFPTKKLTNGFMDNNYPLGNIDETDATIKESNISHVFCGHFHTEYQITDGYQLTVTPSPAFGVDLNNLEFTLTKPRIPIRKIEITGNHTQSTMIFLDK